MGIYVKGNQFHLGSKNTSYIFCVYEGKWLVHLYWGDRLSPDVDLRYTSREFIFFRANAFHVPLDRQNRMFMSDLQFEFSVVGGGDYRIPAFAAQYADGSTVTELVYDSYRIYDGKEKLPGLPAVYAQEDDAQTIEITLKDKMTGLTAVLCYSVFPEYDVITRSIRYENHGSDTIRLTSCQSAVVDFSGIDYKVMNLYGDWAQERKVEWQKLGHSIINIDSKRGMSSHMHNPFIVLADPDANEYSGQVYAMALVYSGDFSGVAEGNSCGGTRLSIGINPFGFSWNLSPAECFQTPEAVLVHSGSGLGAMSRRYHKIFRERLCRGKYRDRLRPMVINHWEGTAFDFDEEKLVSIAKKGAELGLELFVVDDGWFGKRNDDTNSLGDWYVNQEKLPGGLNSIAAKINGLGMQFGIWVEPEMVSPDSELYREHPDWCMHSKGRTRTQNRHQLVLDLSRPEICEYIVDVLTGVFASANIEYVKWDCNRNITETQTPEQKHRYILGLYKILDTLNARFPDILFEGCSGGGGRFDAGMLYYMPQTWTSDNTYPMARLNIQYGTSMLYPPVTMTAHVGSVDVGYDCENQYMNTCALVSMGGNFGYEMDLSKLSPIETEQAKSYVDLYREIRPTIQFGDFYRIESPFAGEFVSWMFMDADRTVLFAYQKHEQTNGEERRVKLRGVDETKNYIMNGKTYSGEVLAKVGFRIPLARYDYQSYCFVFAVEKSDPQNKAYAR